VDWREHDTEVLRLDIGTTFCLRLFLLDMCRCRTGVPLLLLPLLEGTLSSDTSLSTGDDGSKIDLGGSFFGVVSPELDIVITGM